MKPFCFVLMPFGTKSDGNNKEIDFDKVYTSFIKPAIIEAGLEPIRADEEKMGGFIHKPMYERLMFCEFAVADLSFANANVFYELGIRHALRPHTTVSIFEVGTKLPFDTAPLRTFPYDFDDGHVKELETKIRSLTALIASNKLAQSALDDSPVGQLIKGYRFPDLKHLEKDADSFADVAKDINAVKDSIDVLVVEWKELEDERQEKKGIDCDAIVKRQNEIILEVDKIRVEREATLKYNFDLLSAILEAYKSVNSFEKSVELLKPLVESSFKNSVYIRQQLALSYNKTKERQKAHEILTSIVTQYGPDPETNGLLGAVYKGWMTDNGNDPSAVDYYGGLAVDTYLEGFKSDPRDYYPGVNALTILFFLGLEEDERFVKYYPLVSYAVERLEVQRKWDYWLYATGLELATLKLDKNRARKYLWAALGTGPKKWQKESTYGNLKKIYDRLTNVMPGIELDWLIEILTKLKSS